MNIDTLLAERVPQYLANLRARMSVLFATKREPLVIVPLCIWNRQGIDVDNLSLIITYYIKHALEPFSESRDIILHPVQHCEFLPKADWWTVVIGSGLLKTMDRALVVSVPAESLSDAEDFRESIHRFISMVFDELDKRKRGNE